MREVSALSRERRIWMLLAAVLCMIAATFLFLPVIPQSEDYHRFADGRMFFGIPNGLNVASNFLFFLVGAWGIAGTRRIAFVDPKERWPYLAFFIGVLSTAFGSAYYHLDPRDGTLLWDRIPMAIGFTALVAAIVGERMSPRAGARVLLPLMATGAGTVIYWDWTQRMGRGDLRPYALLQFGSVVVILMLLALFPPRYSRQADLLIALAIYALAKILEAADRTIFAFGGIVSGHTLKHVAAAISAYWILRMLHRRDVCTAAVSTPYRE